MNGTIDKFAKKLDEKGMKVSFGLEQQGHIPTIEKWLYKFDNRIYSKDVWNHIGKQIGWCPLTASLSYFKYLEGKK